MIPGRTKILLSMTKAGFSGILLGFIRLYQLALSPFFGTQCRFTPSCSHYACEAIRSHGPLRGSMLASYRILRCNPFCQGGHDPVPESINGKETA
jgi:putative membrane protein insertion efficiency factor